MVYTGFALELLLPLESGIRGLELHTQICILVNEVIVIF